MCSLRPLRPIGSTIGDPAYAGSLRRAETDAAFPRTLDRLQRKETRSAFLYDGGCRLLDSGFWVPASVSPQSGVGFLYTARKLAYLLEINALASSAAAPVSPRVNAFCSDSMAGAFWLTLPWDMPRWNQ